MTANPQWKMQWDYIETVRLVDFLVKKTATSERESHYHELWSEVFNFLCKALKKDYAILSCIPQFELGYQPNYDSGANNRTNRPYTRSMARESNDAVDFVEMVDDGLQDESMDSGYTIAINVGESAGNINRGSSRNILKINWRRPDWLIIGRIFTKAGRVPGVMSFADEKERPILLVELKLDPNGDDIGDVEPGEEPDTSHIDDMVSETIPQVLQQAQFVFAEFPDTVDSIHAIIAVGTFCQDFSISRSRLPPLSEEMLKNPTNVLTEQQKEELLSCVVGRTKTYHVLNKERTGFHQNFLRAWWKARRVCSEFKSYPRFETKGINQET